MASVGLEYFCDECIRRSKERNFDHSIFEGMRTRHGTVAAIKTLVEMGGKLSGIKKLSELGLLDWSVEATVVKFPEEFTPRTLESAKEQLRRERAESKKTVENKKVTESKKDSESK
jgi:hypothetical protein